MAFPPETVSLGIAWANKKVAATYKLPGNPLLAWNGSAGVVNTPANLVLGAINATCDAEGAVSFQPVAGLTVQYLSEVWPVAGSALVASDITTAPTGVYIPLAQGGITTAIDAQLSGTHGSGAWGGGGGSGGYSGTAQGAGSGANTIQLAAGASALQNYVGQQIVINFGAVGTESNVVVSYDGTTKIATCQSNWTNTITNTTPYLFPGMLRPAITIEVTEIAVSP